MAAGESPVHTVAWKAGPGPWTIAAILAVGRLAMCKGGWNSSPGEGIWIRSAAVTFELIISHPKDIHINDHGIIEWVTVTGNTVWRTTKSQRRFSTTGNHHPR